MCLPLLKITIRPVKAFYNLTVRCTQEASKKINNNTYSSFGEKQDIFQVAQVSFLNSHSCLMVSRIQQFGATVFASLQRKSLLPFPYSLYYCLLLMEGQVDNTVNKISFSFYLHNLTRDIRLCFVFLYF